MDHVFDQALDYLNRFDQSNGFLIHLNWPPIKHKGSNQNLNGLKIGFQPVQFIMGAKQTH